MEAFGSVIPRVVIMATLSLVTENKEDKRPPAFKKKYFVIQLMRMKAKHLLHSHTDAYRFIWDVFLMNL